MTKEDIFRDFLEKCKEYDETLKDFFNRFLNIIIKEHVIEEIRLKKRKIPIPFNILHIFKNHTNEVKNSFLLKEILNAKINGIDLRGDFIRYLNTLFVWKLDDQAVKPVKIEKKCTDSGRIDIFIEGKNFTLIIENKIDARDQPQQLKRYIDSVRNKYAKDIYVIYLTRWGYTPSENSLPVPLRNELGKKFRLLKHGNIGQWIELLLEKDEYACIKTNQAYKYLYSGLLQFMHTELLLSNMTQEDNVTKEVIKSILQKYFSENGKTTLSDLEEYKSIFCNAEAVIAEMIKEEQCNNFLKDNNVEKYFSFADKIVKIVMDVCDKKKISYDRPVKSFRQFKTGLLQNFDTVYYAHLLEITVNENIPPITVEIGYGYKEFYGTYFGVWDAPCTNNPVLEEILEKKIKPLFKDNQYYQYTDDGWQFLYTFEPGEKISEQEIVDDIMKLCELCK